MVTVHLRQPVSKHTPVEVQLIVGGNRQTVIVDRPTGYEMLSVASLQDQRSEWLNDFGRHTIAKRLATKYLTALKVPYFLDTRYGHPNNIAHCLQEFIPAFLLARKTIPGLRLISRPLGARFRELFYYFDIQPIETYRPVVGNKVQLWLSRGLAQYPIETETIYPQSRFMDGVYEEKREDGHRRIFLARKGTRALINEVSIKLHLEAYGFVTFYLEDYSVCEQIRIVRAADDIVAIHGAAMAFLTLKSHMQSVTEIMPPNVYTDHFPMLLGHKTERYTQVIPSFNEDVPFSGWSAILAAKHSSFAVEPALLNI